MTLIYCVNGMRCAPVVYKVMLSNYESENHIMCMVGGGEAKMNVPTPHVYTESV